MRRKRQVVETKANQAQITLIKEFPTIGAVKSSDWQVLDIFRVSQTHIYRHVWPLNGCPMRRTSTSFATVERNLLVAPNIRNRAAFGGVQSDLCRRSMQPYRAKPTTDRTVTFNKKPTIWIDVKTYVSAMACAVNCFF